MRTRGRLRQLERVTFGGDRGLALVGILSLRNVVRIVIVLQAGIVALAGYAHLLNLPARARCPEHALDSHSARASD